MKKRHVSRIDPVTTGKGIQDISRILQIQKALKESESRYKALVETSPIGIVVHDGKRIRFANPAALRMIRAGSMKDVLGKKVMSLVHPSSRKLVADRIAAQKKGQFASPVAETFVRLDGTPFEVEVSAAPIIFEASRCMQVVFIDITERRKAELAAWRGNRSVSLMMACNEAIVRENSESSLLAAICHILTGRGGYLFAWVGYAVDDERKSVRPMAQSGFNAGYLDALRLTWANKPLGRGPTGTAIRTKQLSIAKDILTDKRFSPWRKEALKRGYRSSIALPLISDTNALGTINIYSRIPDAFDKQELDMLTELARNVTYGIMGHRNREALRQSEKRFRNVFQNSSIGMLLVRPDYRFILANPAAERILGYSEIELKRLTFKDITHPEDLVKDIPQVERLSRGDFPVYRTEKRYIRKDGTVIWASVSISTMRDSDGSLMYFIALIEDISQRRELEDRLRASEKNLSEMIEFLPDATFALDLDGRILLWNPAMERMTGKKAKEMLRKGNREYAIPFYKKRRPGIAELLLAPDSRYERKYVNFKRMKDTITAEVFIPDLKGKDAYLWVIAKPLYSPEGRKVGVIESIRDITEFKANQEELVKQKEQVEVLSRLKERFMADLTHELKTPLSVILLHLNMFRKMDPESKEAAHSYDLMWRNARRINLSIDQIMQLTKLDSIVAEYKRFSITDMAKEVCSEYAPLAKSKGIDLKVGGPPIRIQSDRHFLAMVLNNLVSNAIKFTEKGAVGVTWKSSNSGFEIQVSDTGIGLLPENRSKLFTMFFKEHHDAPGSGIGLALSNEIVKRMGGRMEYRAVPGKGSVFRIVIPKEAKKT